MDCSLGRRRPGTRHSRRIDRRTRRFHGRTRLPRQTMTSIPTAWPGGARLRWLSRPNPLSG